MLTTLGVGHHDGVVALSQVVSRDHVVGGQILLPQLVKLEHGIVGEVVLKKES